MKIIHEEIHEDCFLDKHYDTGDTYCTDHKVKVCQVCYQRIKEGVNCDKHYD